MTVNENDLQARPGRTRRRAFAADAALATAGVGVLSACAAPGSETTPPPSTKEVTISYVSDWSASPRVDWIKVAIPRFTEENPKIKVQVDNWTGEVGVTAIANAAAGTLQDVMLGANDVFITLIRGGGMKDIAPILTTQKWKMNDVFHLPSTHSCEGKQCGMPFQFIFQANVVIKTLFKQAGVPLPSDKTTYPELLDMLRKVARPSENIHGFMGGGGGASNWGQWLPFVSGFGGER